MTQGGFFFGYLAKASFKSVRYSGSELLPNRSVCLLSRAVFATFAKRSLSLWIPLNISQVPFHAFPCSWAVTTASIRIRVNSLTTSLLCSYWPTSTTRSNAVIISGVSRTLIDGFPLSFAIYGTHWCTYVYFSRQLLRNVCLSSGRAIPMHH